MFSELTIFQLIKESSIINYESLTLTDEVRSVVNSISKP